MYYKIFKNKKTSSINLNFQMKDNDNNNNEQFLRNQNNDIGTYRAILYYLFKMAFKNINCTFI